MTNTSEKKIEELSKKFLQSYCYTEFGDFFVSTCYRRSSAMLAPDSWYYETFAWKLKKGTNERETSIIADNSGASFVRKAINQHMEVVHQLNEKGEFNDDQE